MLDYENQIFLDAFHDDGLLIMSRGLGVNRIFTEFLKVYCDPASLVLVLNTSPSDEVYFIEQLERHGIVKTPRVVTNEINASERQKTYAEGGVLFITSRILVVDLLTDRVPVQHVSGMLVYKAHKIIESCQEAFILRLFRQKNKTGFVKAFTEHADSFTSGYCQVERVMRNLFVKKLYLWPRFQASVVSCFNRHKVCVVEVHQSMSPAMTACQTALLDLINACINELKRANPSVDTEEITVENALSKAFELVIRLQLEPIWHQLSARTRQLVADLKTLRLILRHLTQYDCVTFYSLVQSIRTSEQTFGKNTGWLFLDAADSLFVHAKERVHGSAKLTEKERKKKQKLSATDKDSEEQDGSDEELTPTLEPCPKWSALSEILSEIARDEDEVVVIKDEGEMKEEDIDEEYRILICAEDDRTCCQIKEFLCEGAEPLMTRLYQKYLALRKGRLAPKSKRDMGFQDPSDDGGESMTLTQMVRAGKDPGSSKATGQSYSLVTSPLTIVHPLHGCSDPHGLAQLLDEVKPKYVIIYDADMALVRQLEVFKASHPGRPLMVYFMMYKGSVEEQRYLTSLRREKEAFEYLIREKATMVINEDQDGLNEDCPSRLDLQATSSRQGGASAALSHTPTVIVDMREFRSELPSLIHRRGIQIEPVTIEVGDYILTPDICVERKSVSDLIGSLNNGRLYQQALAISRYYKRPMLLIEFDANKPFSLQARSTVSGDVSLQDVTSKLAMLTMHFPKLRILWCPSPYASAELFEQLKAGRPQPTAEMALTVTATASEMPEWNDKYNHRPQDFLLRMPGVTTKNFHSIMREFRDLRALCQASLEGLSRVLGSSVHARELYSFLHQDHSSLGEQATSKEGPTQARGKGKKFVGGRGRGLKRKK